MSKAKSSNQAKAPECAAFVEQMRSVFGDVKVLYVEEGIFKLGDPIDQGVEFASATSFDVKGKTLLARKAA